MKVEEYLAQIEGMATRLREAQAHGCDVRFAMPPKEFMVIAGLDDLGARLARSDEARTLIRTFAQEDPIPTVFMLGCALDLAGLPYDVLNLEELGLGGGRPS